MNAYDHFAFSRMRAHDFLSRSGLPSIGHVHSFPNQGQAIDAACMVFHPYTFQVIGFIKK
jgi:hypothetical protein